jgi:hypothetical protein
MTKPSERNKRLLSLSGICFFILHLLFIYDMYIKKININNIYMGSSHFKVGIITQYSCTGAACLCILPVDKFIAVLVSEFFE